MKQITFTSAIVLLLLANGVLGQTILNIQGDTSFPSIVCDSTNTVQFHIDTLVNNHHRRGYLLASCDSLTFESDTAFAYFNRRQRFNIVELKTVAGRKHTTEKITSNRPDIFFDKTGKKTLLPFENKGYPFAQVAYTVVADGNDQLRIHASVNAGTYFAYDSLIVKSEIRQSTAYFEQYLNIRKGQPYSEKDFRNISKRIKELDFVELIRPSEALFHSKGADISVYLKSKRANRFDGIVGFQPDANTGKIVLTGNVNLGLQNVLKRGEQFNLEWKRLQFQTQDLKISAAYPYILSTRIGLWGDVQLYRRDTTFTTNKIELSAGLVIGQGKYLRAFTEWYATNPLRENLINIDNINVRRYGVAARSYNTDYTPNPMRGYLIEGQASAGIKTTFNQENIDQKSSQYAGTGTIRGWIPIINRLSAVFSGTAGTKIDSSLLVNEQYRIGGLHTLRGFNEESIFASTYAIFTTELKFQLDKSSAVFLFYDQAWYERNDNVYFSDTPFGFGAGALLGTANGSFSIFYALGSEQNNPILLRNGKIHFGFINRF
ncbi:MAG: hypothetical protein NWR73_08915 [Flavobacteriales bacterium]|nr:hypothetical protein [Flavobacteriales bacterium]